MATVTADFLVEDPRSIDQLIHLIADKALAVEPLREVRYRDRFFDTPKWEFAEAGWAYHWTVAAGERSIRLESINHPHGLVGERWRQNVVRFPKRPEDLPPGVVQEQLLRLNYGHGLQQLFECNSRYREYRIQLAEGIVLALSVEQSIIHGTAGTTAIKQRPIPFTKLHFEHCEGLPEALMHFIDHLQPKYALVPSKLTTFERGLRFLGLPSPPDLPPTAEYETWLVLEQTKSDLCPSLHPLKKTDAAWKLVQCYLLENFRQLLVYEPHAWEGLHPEGVHQMRVATRRMRAAIRAFGRLLPELPTKHINQELKWLASHLGKVRDLDVHLEHFGVYKSVVTKPQVPLLEDYQQYVVKSRLAARQELLQCLSSQRFSALKASLYLLLQSKLGARLERSTRKASISKAASLLIKKQYKSVLRQGRSIDDCSPSTDVHRLRIQCKRLRYLFEIFQPIHGYRLAKFIRRLKSLQGLLGEFQDACVASDSVRVYAEQLPMQEGNREQLVVCGQLLQAHDRTAQCRRLGLSEEWSHFDDPGRLKKLLATLR